MTEQLLKFPGYYDAEIDASYREVPPSGTPAAIIGAAVQGPAFVPTTLGSLSDQIARFGAVTPGYPATYASQRWLENKTSAVFVRLLGAGANSGSGEFDDTRTKGIVKNAGFSVSSSVVAVSGDGRHQGAVQFLVGRHILASQEAYGYPLFTDNGSYALTGNAVNLVRGMIFCSSGSRIMIMNGTGETYTNTLDDIATIDSGSTSATYGKFKLIVSTSLGATFGSMDGNDGIRIYTASFDPSATDYYAKLLNTDPDKFAELGHYLYADFPVDAEIAAIATGSAVSSSIAIVSGSSAFTTTGGITDVPFRNLFGRFDTRYTTPRTPSFISQPFGNIEHELFYFETISDGANANEMVKVSIANLKASSDPRYDYGTFSVIVRDFNDTDFEPQVLEQFTNVNLDPDSESYIGRIVGDIKTTYKFDFESESDRGLQTTGTYPNRSRYIRVQINQAVANKTVPAKSLPFGFKGVPTLKTTNASTDVSGLGRFQMSGSGTTLMYPELTGSIVPPLPFRFKITRGDVSSSAAFTGQPGSTEIVDARLFWGVKFERNDTPTNSNISLEPNQLVRSYARFLGISKLDTLVTGSTVDTFNENKFTLARVAFANGGIVDLTGSIGTILKNAAYIRNGTPDGTNYTITDGSFGARITLASVLQKGTASEFNRFTDYAKFTSLFYGGFDGVNLLDKDARKFTDRSTSTESGSIGYGGAASSFTSPGFTTNMNGAGDANNQTNSYKTAVRIVTDPLTSPANIIVLPGQREPNVTDYAAQEIKDFGRAFYIMDIPTYDSDIVRIFDNETGRFIDNQKTGEEFDSRTIDNNCVAVYHPNVTIDDPLNDRRTVVPASVAALAAYGFNDRVAYPWYAAAGLNRAALSFVKAVAQRTRAADKSAFTDQRINPIFKDEGTFVIFSQFTLKQGVNALTSRVNIKRLSIEIIRLIAGIGNNLLFEQLTPAIRDRFTTAVSLQLSTIQQAKGIKSFKVICDDTINTVVDSDNNKLNARIEIQPVESIEHIALDFVITGAGSTFLIS
jgi:hypothetical protein